MPIIDPLDAPKGIVDPLDSPKGDMTLGQMGSQAIRNLPRSSLETGKSMVEPFLHPIETAKNVGRVATGALSKTGLFPPSGNEKYADAVGQFFKERYGGVENIKHTIAQDPVGVMADLSTVLTGGGIAAARAPGIVGKIGEVARTAGNVTNPLSAVTGPAKAIKHVTGGVSEIPSQLIGGVVTHTGAEGVKGAFAAGREGGKENEAFLHNLREPEVAQKEIVPKFKSALKEIIFEKSTQYQKGMEAVGLNPKIMKFDEIDKAVREAKKVKSFEGVPIADLAGAKKPLPATEVFDQIHNAISTWKGLPEKFHTAAGFDALKQYIGDIKDAQPFGSPERKVANDLYGSVRNTIAKQDTNYNKVMGGYSKAMDMIEDIEKTLSLGKKASEDTALRKILSSTRSNVNTNFGRRMDLAKELGEKDKTLIPSLSGQSLSPWFPQGLGRLNVGGVGLASLLAHNPHLLAALIGMSPRVWGEVARGAGSLTGKAERAIPKAVKDAAQKAGVPIMDAAGKVNPEALKQLLLAARATGGPNASQ